MVPMNCAEAPPRSMSPTSGTGASAWRATRMLTMSCSSRLISAGLPSPGHHSGHRQRGSYSYWDGFRSSDLSD